MRRLPPLHSLRAFEAAARHLSFAAAAKELHLDPTAISHQVRKLEELLGVSLFHRRPRPLRLTQTGALLYPQISKALDTMANAVAKAARNGGAPLVISMSMGFAGHWFAPRVPQIIAATGLAISVHADNNPVDLSGDRVDLAIRSRFQPETGRVSHRLFEDRLIPVAAPVLFDDLGRPKMPEEILKGPLIDYEWSSSLRKSLGWRGWIAEANLDPGDLRFVAIFTEESHAVQSALAGTGMALLSERLIADFIAKGDLVPIGTQTLNLPPVWAIHRADHPRADDLVKVVDALRSQLIQRNAG